MSIPSYIVLQGDVADSGELSDVTLTGPAEFEVLVRDGSSQWVNQLLATASFGDGSVTLAKIADAAANDKLVGSGNAGSGNPYVELSIGSSFVMNTTTLERAALTGDVTASQDSNATTIAAGVVTLAKIADAIGNDKLVGSNNTGSGNPYIELTLGTNLTITGSTLDAAGGGASALNDLSDVTLTSPATDSILIKTAGDYIDGLIVTNSITNAAVTLAKIQDAGGNEILVGSGAAGSGNPYTEITIGPSLNFDGTVLERSAISGDVVIPLDSNTATIQPDSVTFDMMVDLVGGLRVMGRGPSTGGTISTIDSSAAFQVLKVRADNLALEWDLLETGNYNDSSVTLAKIADAGANDKLLGSGDAGSGNPYVEITLGANLTMTGTTLAATGGGATSLNDLSDVTLTSPATDSILIKTAGDYIDGLIVTNSITNSAVTLAKIANAAANERLVGSGAAGSGSAYTELTIASSLSFSGTELAVTDPSSAGLSDYVLVDRSAANQVVADHINRTIEGNARGTSAVDLQMARVSAGQVAAANSSTIGGGENNEISAGTAAGVICGGATNLADGGTGSTIVGGQNNTITGSGNGSFIGAGLTNTMTGAAQGVIAGGQLNEVERNHGTIPGGAKATARRFGEMAYGGGSQADAQRVMNVATVLTTDATQTIMGYTSTNATWASTTLDAATIPFPSSDTFMLAVEGYVIGMRANVAGDAAAAFKVEFAVKKNDAGTVSFVGNPKVSVVGRDDVNLDCDVVLAGSNAGTNIRVTGIAAQDWVWCFEWEGAELLVPAL